MEQFDQNHWGSEGRFNSPCSVSQRSGGGPSFKDERGTQAQRRASPGQEGGDHQELVQGGGDNQEVIFICCPLPAAKCLKIKMYIKTLMTSSSSFNRTVSQLVIRSMWISDLYSHIYTVETLVTLTTVVLTLPVPCMQ